MVSDKTIDTGTRPCVVAARGLLVSVSGCRCWASSSIVANDFFCKSSLINSGGRLCKVSSMGLRGVGGISESKFFSFGAVSASELPVFATVVVIAAVAVVCDSVN